MWRVEYDPSAPLVWVFGHDTPEPAPADWRDRLSGVMRRVHGVVAVGAKRLTEEGRVFAMGEMLVHPKGFHHLGQGVLGHAYRFPEEVDVLAGGAVVVDRAAFDAAHGHAALNGPLGMLELCLRLRHAGGRCLAAPQAIMTDTFTPQPGDTASADFAKRWGFDWRAPDLTYIQAHYADTGLLWHPGYHIPAMPFDKYESRPAMHWQNYQNVQVYQQRADHIIKLAAQLCPEHGTALDLGCGDGLFAHLLAQNNRIIIGIDPESTAIEQAQQRTAEQSYPANTPRPTFETGFGDDMRFDDQSIDLVMMLDVIEHLANPVATLRETARVLKPGGRCLITTPAWQYGGWSDPYYHFTEYSPEQLSAQVQAAAGLKIENIGRIGGVYRDVVLVAAKPAAQ